MSDKPSFFSELKRRNVYKVAVAYAVVGWLVIQISSTVLPTFHAPEWVVQTLVVLVALGFPIALVLAWAFELTAEGIKRAEDVAPGESITPKTGRKLVAITVVLAVIAGALLLFQLLRPKTEPSVAKMTTATAPIPETTIREKSIAVLPFENLSDDKSNAYFAEGIQDEILTRLSKIAALKVISRTSTQKYKSAPDHLREIGQQLGVANLLEGSVQKAGNAVHINVQLIKAATDEHLWAESYNRKLDDIFGVEGEVATAIADQLRTKLSGAEEKAVTEKPTQNAAAYDAYLRGVAIEQSRYGNSSYKDAAQKYQEAVQLDPKFALAWARLAIARSYLFWNNIDRANNSVAAMKEAAERAMSLAPEAGESRVALGAYRYRGLRDFEGAVSALKEAQARLPNSAFVYENLGWVLRRLGRWAEAETDLRKALELDPRNVGLLGSLATDFYIRVRRFDDALALVDRALEISPDSATLHAGKANIFQLQARLTDAAQELAHVPPASSDPFVVQIRVAQAAYERRFDTGIEVITNSLQTVPSNTEADGLSTLLLIQLGHFQDWLGRHEEARVDFTKALSDLEHFSDQTGLENFRALAYAGLGQKDQALAEVERALKRDENNAVDKPALETTRAQIQAQFGERDAALAALPHLLEVPSGLTRAELKFYPVWDPLRDDPRFEKIVASLAPK